MVRPVVRSSHAPPSGAQHGTLQAGGRGNRVPKRPGGGEPPPASLEQGLRDLVLQAGPDIRKLSRGGSSGLQAVMRAARPPDHWTIDVKAAAVLEVIHEEVDKINNVRWRAAANA